MIAFIAFSVACFFYIVLFHLLGKVEFPLPPRDGDDPRKDKPEPLHPIDDVIDVLEGK